MKIIKTQTALAAYFLIASLSGGTTIPNTTNVIKGDGGGNGADSGIFPSPDELSVESYASFAAAITAIGSSPKVLVISSSQSVTTNVTVPSTCTLRFAGTGQLAITAGHRVTINGPVQAPIRQIFSINDTMPISFGAGSVSEIWCEWFGAKGDSNRKTGNGTDNTNAIQAAVNSNPIFGGLPTRLGRGTYRITGNILISSAGNQIAMKLAGLGAKYSDASTQLVWDGDTTTPMISLHSRDSVIQGIEFSTALNSSVGKTCVCAIDIDNGESSSYPCTANIVRGCSFNNYGRPSVNTGLTYGIRLGLTATGNCEHMQFIDCQFTNAYGTAGIYVPSHNGQIKDCKCIRCNFDNLPYGVYANAWSCAYDRCSFESCKTSAIYTSASDFCDIIDVDTEGCPQLVHLGGGSLTITSGRIGAQPNQSTPPSVMGGEYIYAHDGMTINGVHFDEPVGNYFYIGAWPNARINLINTVLPSRHWDDYLKPAKTGPGKIYLLYASGLTVNDGATFYNVADGYYTYGENQYAHHDFTGPLLLVEGNLNGWQVTLGSKVRLGNIISPPTLTDSVNDYTPRGIVGANVIRMNGGALNRDITGIAINPDGVKSASNDGRLLEVDNVGTSNVLVLKNQNGSSTSANRFLLPGGPDVTIPVNGSALLRYDAITGAWRLVDGH